mmetsp:Transcript_23806/g.52537  ORF Transcript_23806/g.52537 Transcript_23806/m.52537 type:complete len:219 (+) Transcript_23806:44-700(+)
MMWSMAMVRKCFELSCCQGEEAPRSCRRASAPMPSLAMVEGCRDPHQVQRYLIAQLCQAWKLSYQLVRQAARKAPQGASRACSHRSRGPRGQRRRRRLNHWRGLNRPPRASYRNRCQLLVRSCFLPRHHIGQRRRGSAIGSWMESSVSWKQSWRTTMQSWRGCEVDHRICSVLARCRRCSNTYQAKTSAQQSSSRRLVTCMTRSGRTVWRTRRHGSRQ